MDAGRLRFQKEQDRIEQDKGFGARDDVSKILRSCLPNVTKAILSYLSPIQAYQDVKNSSGSTPQAYWYLSQLDVDLLSLIALSGAFSGIAGRLQGQVTPICTSIGRAVEDEIWSITLAAKDAKLHERLMLRAIKTHGNVSYRKKALRATARKEGYHQEPFPSDLRVKIGAPLLNAVLIGCPEVFETYLARSNTVDPKSLMRCLGLTEAASNMLVNIHETMGWMRPVFNPMIFPPRPWKHFYSGAYLTTEMRSKVPLIRTWDRTRTDPVKEAIRNGSMSKCLDALNLIQSTPWRINTSVMDVMLKAHDQGIEVPGLPRKEHIARPERLENWDDLTDEQQKGWRITAAQVALRNRGIDSDRITYLQDIAVAGSLTSIDRFFLPHSLDFRGRVYPVPHFNTQRADHIKALFEFSDGIALGDEGAYWLAIHVANSGDFSRVSKLPFQDRFNWTVENEHLIQNIAADPFANDTWIQADKPFQFLAACFDYAAFLNNGPGHVSHLPVALDGSNSGLQHYSAALRSLEGALVNLSPSEVPADFYQTVTDAAIGSMNADLTGDSADMAKLVLDNGVDRQLVKRNAMTFSYSSEEYGFKQQQMTDLMKPLKIEVLEGKRASHPYGEDDGFKAAGYIAKKVWHSIIPIVPDAVRGMRFFQRCAAVLAHEGKGLTWVTPDGLPVTHKYTDWDSKSVKIFLFDKNVPVDEAATGDHILGDNSVLKKIRLTVRTEPKKRINKGKAKSAIAPNVIHSLDGAHLRATVLAAAREGITAFSLIHDSFATHAARTSDFFYIIREAFVDLYENYCPFAEIQTRTIEALDDHAKVPPTPIKGSLDVQEITNSLYAFA